MAAVENLRSAFLKSVLNYVPRVPSCPTCLTCLGVLRRGYVLFVHMCFTCLRAFDSYIPSFFTRLMCLPLFMCLTCLHLLLALGALIF